MDMHPHRRSSAIVTLLTTSCFIHLCSHRSGNNIKLLYRIINSSSEFFVQQKWKTFSMYNSSIYFTFLDFNPLFNSSNDFFFLNKLIDIWTSVLVLQGSHGRFDGYRVCWPVTLGHFLLALKVVLSLFCALANSAEEREIALVKH